MARKTPIRHDAIVSAFAEKLRQVRRSRGMTQRDLGRVTQLAESYISRLENGAMAPGIDLVARLARALGVPLEDLLRLPESPDTAALAVATEQAKHLFDSILKSQDPTFVFLLVQNLALISAAVERQR
jgi:transcriptional regulator with XRE-family HTH domain